MFCITFEDGIGATGGSDRPFIENYGVDIVSSTGIYGNGACLEGSKCGFFDKSHIVIPMFSNMYSGFDYLRITFSFLNTETGGSLKGLISNDCHNGQSGKSGNSLYAATIGVYAQTGWKSDTSPTEVNLASVSTSAPLLST